MHLRQRRCANTDCAGQRRPRRLRPSRLRRANRTVRSPIIISVTIRRATGRPTPIRRATMRAAGPLNHRRARSNMAVLSGPGSLMSARPFRPKTRGPRPATALAGASARASEVGRGEPPRHAHRVCPSSSFATLLIETWPVELRPEGACNVVHSAIVVRRLRGLPGFVSRVPMGRTTARICRLEPVRPGCQ